MSQTARRAFHVTPLSDLHDFLLGHFTLERWITGASHERYHLLGDAEFVQGSSDSLEYFERGVLSAPNGEHEVSRSYRYLMRGRSRASVYFSDASFFFDLDLSTGACRVKHRCSEDVYSGVVVADESSLLTRWRCVGPNKHYVVTSRLSR
jgi:hypothetical protein